MQSRLYLRSEEGVVLARVAGLVTVDDYLQMRAELAESAGEWTDIRILADGREIELDLDFDRIRSLGRSAIPFEGGRMAVVVGKALHFGMVRQYAAWVPPTLTVEVFMDLDAACKWLELDPAECEAILGRDSAPA